MLPEKVFFLLPTATCGRDSLTSRIFSKCHASPEAAGSSAIWSAAAETLRTHGGLLTADRLVVGLAQTPATTLIKL